MKKLICILLLLGLTSCVSYDKYTIEVTYTNGQVDTLVYKLSSYPELNDGDLYAQSHGTLISGVRTFKILKQEKVINK